MANKKVKSPAPFLAHWVTGPVACCEIHRDELVRLGAFIGSVVATSENFDETLECENCINKNK